MFAILTQQLNGIANKENVKLLRFDSNICDFDTFLIIDKRQANALKSQSNALGGPFFLFLYKEKKMTRKLDISGDTNNAM